MKAMPRLRLEYSPGWVLLSAYVAMISFLASLIEVSQLYPLVFDLPYTAAKLWAGLLMIVALWFGTHQIVLLVLRLILWPMGTPGRFELSEAGVQLKLGRTQHSLAWSDISAIQTSEDALDLDSASGTHAGARALAKAGASVAAKQWRLTFVSSEHGDTTISSQGFRRPIRRAEPRIRGWLQAHRQVTLEALAEPQTRLTR